MNDQTLKKLIVEEAANLRIHATKKEIDNLSYDTLVGCSKTECIYGQMTGNCNSERAYELIKKCASKIYNHNENEGYYLNGKPYIPDQLDQRSGFYFSPIELLVYHNKYDSTDRSIEVENLVNFLKNKTNTLNF